jgi:KUP system potassium uptake protein
MATLDLKKVSTAGMLVTVGIVYGDIGTSPLYVMNALVGDAGTIGQIDINYMLGAISLIFWTLMIITTIKYVLIAMQADNKGEGGIFSLYALVRHRAKWLVWPALIGGAALLADGTLTPAVTVTSAIEGLKGQRIGDFLFSNSQNTVLLVTSIVLLTLFLIQRFGTQLIGKAFGPIMALWFTFLAFAGVYNLAAEPQMLKALSPYYAIHILFSPDNKVGILILGSIFLATTGAEALYADMGHVGKKNIYATWPLIYVALMLNYFGQGAWVVGHAQSPSFQNATNINPFFAMIPSQWRIIAIMLATLAAIIASQSLITGSYTLVNEAIGLKFLPRMMISHPNNIKGQIYIPTINWIMCPITLAIVWFFRSSHHMESAYGLAITITMLMTTLLLYEFLSYRFTKNIARITILFFASIEGIFLLSSLTKFIHGGYVTIIIMLVILGIMYVWFFGNRQRQKLERASEYVSLLGNKEQLVTLSQDERYPLYATNLVYLTKVRSNYQIKLNTLYSILDKGPKRAKVYWFVTVNETNVPYESYYTVDMMDTKNVVNIQLYLGFRNQQSISVYLHQIVRDLIDQEILDPQEPDYSTDKNRKVGDFKFVIISEEPADLVRSETISLVDKALIGGRIFLQHITPSPISWYRLIFSDVIEESTPLFFKRNQQDGEYLRQRKITNLPPERRRKINKLKRIYKNR